MAEVHDIKWAAGLFEGEGSITLGRTAVLLRLSSTDQDVVKTFARVVGTGTVRVAPRSLTWRWKVVWEWEIGRQAEAREVLEAFLPYLHSRRSARAQQALEWLANRPGQGVGGGVKKK